MKYKNYCRGSGVKPSLTKSGLQSCDITMEEVVKYTSYGIVTPANTVTVTFNESNQLQTFLLMRHTRGWQCDVIGNKAIFSMPDRGISQQGKRVMVGYDARVTFLRDYVPVMVQGDTVKEYVRCEKLDSLPAELWPTKTAPRLFDARVTMDQLLDYGKRLCKTGIDPETVRQIITSTVLYVTHNKYSKGDVLRHLTDRELTACDFLDSAGKFRHDYMGNYLLEQYHICYINCRQFYYDGQSYVESSGIMDPQSTATSSSDLQRIMYELMPNITIRQIREVLSYIDKMCVRYPVADKRYIPCGNGIYDLETDQLLDFNPEIRVTNRIPTDYIPDVYDSDGEKVLSGLACGDPEIRALIEEMAGYCLYRDSTAFRKAFILFGNKRNGKSTFTEWMAETLGRSNCQGIGFSQLSQRFYSATLFGKLANFGDEIPEGFIENDTVAIFKQISAGTSIFAEHKGEKPFTYAPYVKLIFSGNSLPRLTDSSGAVLDRLIIVPFKACFSEDDPKTDNFLQARVKKSEQSKQYLLRLAIEGLKRLLKNGKFTNPAACVETKQDYYLDNDPVAGWLDELGESGIEKVIENETIGRVYAVYETYCASNGFKALSAKKFSKSVTDKTGLIKKKMRRDGKTPYVYKREV